MPRRIYERAYSVQGCSDCLVERLDGEESQPVYFTNTVTWPPADHVAFCNQTDMDSQSPGTTRWTVEDLLKKRAELLGFEQDRQHAALERSFWEPPATDGIAYFMVKNAHPVSDDDKPDDDDSADTPNLVGD